MNGFNRFEISGPDANGFVERIFCGNITQKSGRVSLGYLLNDLGMIKSEATISNIPASDRGPKRMWYGSAAASEFHDMDWLEQNINTDEDVEIRSLTNDQTILLIAGPKAREVLSKCSREDWSKEAFPWLSIRECFIGFSAATVISVSFSGELAYEVHVPNESLYAAYLTLFKAGEEFGMKLFGSRAVESMRMEKGFLAWKSDLLTEFDPYETGLEHFVNLSKDNFIGKKALKYEKENSTTERCLVGLDIDGDKPAHGSVIYNAKKQDIGIVTAAIWSPTMKRNIALASLKRPYGIKIKENIFAEIYHHEEIEYRKIWAKCKVVKRQFYNPERRNKVPADLYE